MTIERTIIGEGKLHPQFKISKQAVGGSSHQVDMDEVSEDGNDESLQDQSHPEFETVDLLENNFDQEIEEETHDECDLIEVYNRAVESNLREIGLDAQLIGLDDEETLENQYDHLIDEDVSSNIGTNIAEINTQPVIIRTADGDDLCIFTEMGNIDKVGEDTDIEDNSVGTPDRSIEKWPSDFPQTNQKVKTRTGEVAVDESLNEDGADETLDNQYNPDVEEAVIGYNEDDEVVQEDRICSGEVGVDETLNKDGEEDVLDNQSNPDIEEVMISDNEADDVNQDKVQSDTDTTSTFDRSIDKFPLGLLDINKEVRVSSDKVGVDEKLNKDREYKMLDNRSNLDAEEIVISDNEDEVEESAADCLSDSEQSNIVIDVSSNEVGIEMGEDVESMTNIECEKQMTTNIGTKMESGNNVHPMILGFTGQKESTDIGTNMEDGNNMHPVIIGVTRGDESTDTASNNEDENDGHLLVIGFTEAEKSINIGTNMYDENNIHSVFLRDIEGDQSIDVGTNFEDENNIHPTIIGINGGDESTDIGMNMDVGNNIHPAIIEVNGREELDTKAGTDYDLNAVQNVDANPKTEILEGQDVEKEVITIEDSDPEDLLLDHVTDQNKVNDSLECKIVAIKNKPLPMGAINRAIKSVPKGTLSIHKSKYSGLGVYAEKDIPKLIFFGPYEGKLKTTNENGEYSWKLGVACLEDTSDEAHSNYFRYIRFCPKVGNQNIYMFQYDGELYYRTSRDIRKNEELLLCVDTKYHYNYYTPPCLDINLDVPFCEICYVAFETDDQRLKDQSECISLLDVREFECSQCLLVFDSIEMQVDHESKCLKNICCVDYIRKIKEYRTADKQARMRKHPIPQNAESTAKMHSISCYKYQTLIECLEESKRNCRKKGRPKKLRSVESNEQCEVRSEMSNTVAQNINSVEKESKKKISQVQLSIEIANLLVQSQQGKEVSKKIDSPKAVKTIRRKKETPEPCSSDIIESHQRNEIDPKRFDPQISRGEKRSFETYCERSDIVESHQRHPKKFDKPQTVNSQKMRGGKGSLESYTVSSNIIIDRGHKVDPKKFERATIVKCVKKSRGKKSLEPCGESSYTIESPQRHEVNPKKFERATIVKCVQKSRGKKRSLEPCSESSYTIESPQRHEVDTKKFDRPKTVNSNKISRGESESNSESSDVIEFHQRHEVDPKKFERGQIVKSLPISRGEKYSLESYRESSKIVQSHHWQEVERKNFDKPQAISSLNKTRGEKRSLESYRENSDMIVESSHGYEVDPVNFDTTQTVDSVQKSSGKNGSKSFSASYDSFIESIKKRQRAQEEFYKEFYKTHPVDFSLDGRKKKRSKTVPVDPVQFNPIELDPLAENNCIAEGSFASPESSNGAVASWIRRFDAQGNEVGPETSIYQPEVSVRQSHISRLVEIGEVSNVEKFIAQSQNLIAQYDQGYEGSVEISRYPPQIIASEISRGPMGGTTSKEEVRETGTSSAENLLNSIECVYIHEFGNERDETLIAVPPIKRDRPKGSKNTTKNISIESASRNSNHSDGGDVVHIEKTGQKKQQKRHRRSSNEWLDNCYLSDESDEMSIHSYQTVVSAANKRRSKKLSKIDALLSSEWLDHDSSSCSNYSDYYDELVEARKKRRKEKCTKNQPISDAQSSRKLLHPLQVCPKRGRRVGRKSQNQNRRKTYNKRTNLRKKQEARDQPQLSIDMTTNTSSDRSSNYTEEVYEINIEEEKPIVSILHEAVNPEICSDPLKLCVKSEPNLEPVIKEEPADKPVTNELSGDPLISVIKSENPQVPVIKEEPVDEPIDSEICSDPSIFFVESENVHEPYVKTELHKEHNYSV